MYAELQGNLFESDAECHEQSSGGHHVSLLQLPDSEEEPLTIAGSGLTFCAWCLKSIPCTCSQRILAECFLLTLKEYGSVNGLRFSLKISDTRSSRSCLVLQTSGHHTSGNEFGWWPTPTVTGNHNRKGLSETSGDGLATAVKKWRTPVADDCNAREMAHNDRGELKLSGQVQKWSTPQARDYRHPDKPDSGRMKNKMAKGYSIDLNSQVADWATPTARDWKSIHASEETMERNARPLREQVGQWDKDTSNTNGKSRESFHLNPRWELQLIGMPADWLDGVEPQ